MTLTRYEQIKAEVVSNGGTANERELIVMYDIRDAAQRETVQGLEQDVKLLKEKIAALHNTVKAAHAETEKVRAELNEIWVDERDETWCRPTAWAYAQVCRVKNEQCERIAALERELEAFRDTAIERLQAQLTAMTEQDERHRLDAEKHYRAATECEQQLTAMTKERDNLKGELEVGLQLTGSFFEALKPLKLSAIHVENPGQHVTDLINQLTAAIRSHAITREGYTALRANYDTLSRQLREAQAELAIYNTVATDKDGTPFAAASSWRTECNRQKQRVEELERALIASNEQWMKHDKKAQTALTACQRRVSALVSELEGMVEVLSAMVFVCRKGAVPLETLKDAEDVLKQHALAQATGAPR